MAKNKKKSGGKKKGKFFSAETRQVSKQQEKKLNPFEVRYQKIKQSKATANTANKLLKLKQAKSDRVSKRKTALLGELKAQNKANKFIDRRGSYGSAEAAEKRKRVRFDFADNEKPAASDTLTHRGVPLDSEDAKAFLDGPIEESDSDMDEQINDIMATRSDSKKSSLQVTLDEIIRNSKKQKAEKQMENERNATLIDQLDAEWKALCHDAIETVKRQHADDNHDDHAHGEGATNATADTVAKQSAAEVKSSLVAKLAVAPKQAQALAELKIPKLSKQSESPDDADFDSLLRELRSDLRSRPLASSNQIANEIEKNRAALLRSIDSNADAGASKSNDSIDRALYAAPTCFEDLRATLAARSYSEQVTLLDSLTVLHYPSHVSPANRLISQRLFLYTLMYVTDLSKTAQESQSNASPAVFLDRSYACLLRLFAVPQLTNTFVTILFRSLENAHRVMRKRIKQRLRHANPAGDDASRYGQLINGHICWLMRVSLMLFERTPSYSKLSVRVTGPICDVLRSIEPLLAADQLTSRELAAVIFLQTLLIEHVDRSGNCYVPELVRSVRLVLHAITSKLRRLSTSGKSDAAVSRIDVASLFVGPGDELQLVRGCAMASLTLINELVNAYRSLPSFLALFSPIVAHLSALRTTFGTRNSEAMQQFESAIAQCNGENREAPLEALTFDRERLKMLQQFEPRLSSKFAGGDAHSDREKRTKATRVHKALLRKVKQEEKGAMRELRRDADVLRRVTIDEQRKKDADRRRKVKRILGDLGQQEGDFRAIKRGKGDEDEETSSQ